MSMSRLNISRLLFLPAVGLAGGGVALALVGFGGKAPQEDPPVVQPSVQTLSQQDDIEKVAESVRPSVVSITSVQTANNMALQGGGLPFGFPNQPGIRVQPFGQQPNFPQHSIASGSGVIVRSDGYILTNDHVVAGAEKVTVRLLDGRKFVGKVYEDHRSDLALIKIAADNLPAAHFANSGNVKVGEFALAFGSPFDLSDTMTMGIISSLHRSATIADGADARYYPSLLQTDASINPGNSGGPLVDIYGRVIGIDTAIESQSGGNVGIGFAIPANQAKYIMDRLISDGKVVRGYLGLVPKSLTYNQKQEDGVQEGAFVQEVEDGTPASKAGIQPGDVITQFDNKPIISEESFRDIVERTAPGTNATVVVHRNGQDMNLQATVGTMPSDVAAPPVTPSTEKKTRGKLGVEIGSVTDPAVRRQLNIDNSLKSGAVIVQVYPGSPADMGGLMPGDVVTEMNGKPIENAQQFSDAIAALPAGARAQMMVRRFAQGKGASLIVSVTLY